MPSPHTGAGSPRRGFAPTYGAVLGLGALVWAVSLGLQPLSDNSFLTHLATGRMILDDVGIPGEDPFSFTAGGEPWVVQSWLPASLYAALERLGGASLVRLGFAVQMGALALLIWALARSARSVIPRVAIVGLALGIGAGTWSERPLLVGLIGIGVSLLSTRSRRWPWWLVPMFWVWVSSHGSFPLGLLVLAAAAAGQRLDREPHEPGLRALAMGAAGSVLGVLNPLGPVLLVFPVKLLSRHDVLSNITEWQAPEFTSTWERLFLLQALLAVLALVRRPSWRSGLLVALALALSVLALRNIAVGSLLLVPVLSEGFGDLGSLRIDSPLPLGRPLLALGVVLAAAVLAGGLSDDDYDLKAFPVRALAWLQAEGVDVRDERVVAPDYVGNYLEALHGERATVYIDDRYDMYPSAVAFGYLALLRGQPEWQQVLDRSGADVVVWDVEQPLTQLLEERPDWRVVYRDSRFAVFYRRGADVGAG